MPLSLSNKNAAYFHKLLKSMTNHSFLCSSCVMRNFHLLACCPHTTYICPLNLGWQTQFLFILFFKSQNPLFQSLFWLLPMICLIGNNVTDSFLCTNFSIPPSDPSPNLTSDFKVNSRMLHFSKSMLYVRMPFCCPHTQGGLTSYRILESQTFPLKILLSISHCLWLLK